MRCYSPLSIGCGILVVSLLASFQPDPPPANSSRVTVTFPDGGKYIGSKGCKACHSKEETGKAHAIWSESKHTGAFATLASPAAKKIAKEKGIEDPQKSKECLQCHVTAHGEPADLTKRIKPAEGVQCESCHGPGDTHRKARMKAAGKKGVPVPPGEIHSGRSFDACGKCHNKKSPTFKPFCLVEQMAKIEHLDPRKKRSKEEIEKLRKTCSPDCKTCKAKAKEKKDGEGK